MIGARRTLARGARGWLRRTVIAISAMMMLSGGVLALYVARPQSGLGRDVLAAIEYPLRLDDGVQYNVHRALGKIFSLCPCTAGLSADQYRRAWYHRPEADTYDR